MLQVTGAANTINIRDLWRKERTEHGGNLESFRHLTTRATFVVHRYVTPVTRTSERLVVLPASFDSL